MTRSLGPFHTQCSMMSAIYECYKGSELGDVLVAGGVIADGSLIPYLADKIKDNLEILRNANLHKNLVLMHIRHLRKMLT